MNKTNYKNFTNEMQVESCSNFVPGLIGEGRQGKSGALLQWTSNGGGATFTCTGLPTFFLS